ncbi:MAG: hypothetical protein WCP18_04065 [bacterium]
MLSKKIKTAWIVTVDMGYGHQRAAYPFKSIAEGGEIITANDYPGIPEKDKLIWTDSRMLYEFISRFKKVPFIGDKIFEFYDQLQTIPAFYPRRDLSKSNIQLKQTYELFRKADWGKHLIDKLAKKPRPLVTTFFVTAMMAEYFNYPGEIYCILCDADISRTWVPPKPKDSRIIYLASNRRVEERLKLYGVDASRIFLTGFPLPNENVGLHLKTIKEDLGRRLIQLDPQKIYINRYKKTLVGQLGSKKLKMSSSRPVTITFCVGGAGAQRELGMEIAQSLKQEIIDGQFNLNLVAGVNIDVEKYFRQEIAKIGLDKFLGKNIKIVFNAKKDDYFIDFNKCLRTTDILWTKPSELSFYCGLGLPIIMAPPIGSQEEFNRKWLESIGAGMDQEDPKYVNEWLVDWLKSGWLAEASMQGYTEAPKHGTFNIKKIVFHEYEEVKSIHTVLQY